MLVSIPKFIPEMQSSVESAKEAFLQKHQCAKKTAPVEEKEFDSPTFSMTRDVIAKHYNLDAETIRRFNETKERKEKRAERRKELETEMGVLRWDIDQTYQEIKEEKQANNENSREIITDLNAQIADMNKRIKEIKNELYYL